MLIRQPAESLRSLSRHFMPRWINGPAPRRLDLSPAFRLAGLIYDLGYVVRVKQQPAAEPNGAELSFSDPDANGMGRDA